MRDVVVIAAHGDDYVQRCVDSLGDVPHVVVRTDPDGEAPGQYPTGAYLWAHRHVDADAFLFIHDSMVAYEDPRPWFRDQMPGSFGAVGWGLFSIPYHGFVSDEQAKWVYAQYPSTTVTRGIFGSIFYTTRATLDFMKASDALPVIPRSKWQDQGLERVWAFAFDVVGAPLVGRVWTHNELVAADCYPLRKVYGGRQ